MCEIDALKVGCPTCCASPGKPCVDQHDSADMRQWTEMDSPHPNRVEAAQFVAAVDAGMDGSQVHEATAQEIDDAATERLF